MNQPILDVFVETIAHRIAESVTREVRACLGKGHTEPHPQPLPASPTTALPSEAELVDVEQASLITSIPKRTLDNWRGKHAQRQGKGPPFIKLGEGRNALVRYQRKDLEAWVRNHRVARG